MAAGSHALSTLVTFTGANGLDPQAGLVADASGNLYGTTVWGTGNYGTIFAIDAISHAQTTLATFQGGDGANPYGSLIFDASGNLYGTTSYGGANDYGTVFEVAAGSHALTTLATFTGANGAGSIAGLIADASGNLYGTTYFGGSSDSGTVFEVTAGSHALTTLATFTGANGAGPAASLIVDASGNLYGTTAEGGATDQGTVFEVAAGSHALTTLATFTGANGANPRASLIFDASGNLYGTTRFGSVFELSPASSAAVPEPSSFFLLCLGGLLLVLARHCRRFFC